MSIAENVVISKPSLSGRGWSCQAADPPNHFQDATVEASLVACRVAVDPTQAALLNPKPALRCSVTQGRCRHSARRIGVHETGYLKF